VPITLPLLPVSAFATPADPTVEAYEEWRKAYRAFLVAMKTREGDHRLAGIAPRPLCPERALWRLSGRNEKGGFLGLD